ncbi:hypothetical protein EKH55_4095 [Sinorhizobium alkalisoli]|nr:hypothetical protein EKH55_4095 [Sinorhizobium alkalisoli]
MTDKSYHSSLPFVIVPCQPEGAPPAGALERAVGRRASSHTHTAGLRRAGKAH